MGLPLQLHSYQSVGMDNTDLYSKLASLPDDLKSEVGDFIDFLATKAKKKINKKPNRNLVAAKTCL
jgi:hypothetical protein